MLLTFSAGVMFWLAYGLRLGHAGYLADAVTLALLLIIMVMKVRYAAR